jgi:RND superfamily putative drug exporter
MVAGTLKVGGLLLPERASSLRTRSAWADTDSLRDALEDGASVLLFDLRTAAGAHLSLERIDAMHSAFAARKVAVDRGGAPLTLIVLGDRGLAEEILPTGVKLREASEASGMAGQLAPVSAQTSIAGLAAITEGGVR